MSLPLPSDADYYRSLSSLHLEVERQRLIAIVDRISVIFISCFIPADSDAL